MVRSRLILIDETVSPPPVNGFRDIFYTNFLAAGSLPPPPADAPAPGSEQRGTDKIVPPLQLPQRPATQASAQVLSFCAGGSS